LREPLRDCAWITGHPEVNLGDRFVIDITSG
jgi:hypothetical protein